MYFGELCELNQNSVPHGEVNRPSISIYMKYLLLIWIKVNLLILCVEFVFFLFSLCLGKTCGVWLKNEQINQGFCSVMNKKCDLYHQDAPKQCVT